MNINKGKLKITVVLDVPPKLLMPSNCFRQRSHNAEGIWKHGFISTVRPAIHTNPSRKRSFSKTLFKGRGIWKRWPCVFVWTEFILKTKLFENDSDKVTISMCFPLSTEVFSNTNPKWTVIVAFLNSPCVVWTKNIWYVFTVKPPFSNSSGVLWK